MQQLVQGIASTMPGYLRKELELDHKERCKEFAAVTLPCYREDPSAWPPDSFEKVLSLIMPYIAYLRVLECSSQYPNLDQLLDELASLRRSSPSEMTSYAKRAFETNARLQFELAAVVDAAISDTSAAGGEKKSDE